MGEIAEMMLDGTLCMHCGGYMGGGEEGFPVSCCEDYEPDYTTETETKSDGRKRRKKRKQENYRDMQSLLQKTSNMILKSMAGEEITKGEWNNHNQAIVARLMRVR